MLLLKPLSEAKSLVFELNTILRSWKKDTLSQRQCVFIALIISAMALSGQLNWNAVDRASLGRIKTTALSWMLRCSKILWEEVLQAAGYYLLQPYGVFELQGYDRQSAIKQVDRFFSNRKIKLLNFFLHWIPYIVQKRQQIVVSLDWTDFDKNDQATLCLNVITNHGRATPLLWKTHLKSTFKNNQRKYKISLLKLLKSFLPATCE